MLPMYTILLYYKYADVSDPIALRNAQRLLCEKLGLKGRIIISKEGINGTVEGLDSNIQTYIEKTKADTRFADFSDIDFKKSEGNGKLFPKLSVKVREEIVTLGTGTAPKANFKRGIHLPPDELQKWYDEGRDFVVVDMRNDYEHNVGHFENSVRLPVQNFREIPEHVEKNPALTSLKGKTIVNVCTGGVRCEKATNYLLEKGYEHVYQLEGGIVRYLEKHPGKKFKGSLYVFDGRVVVNYDSPEQHEVVGRCTRCNTPSERCVNCENLDCHGHFVCCEDCSEGGIFCSDQCRESEHILTRGR